MNRYALVAIVGLVAAIGLPGSAVSVSPDANINPRALYLLGEMSRRLAATEQVTVHVEAIIENVDEVGFKLRVGRSMDIALRRPDRLAIQTQGEEGRSGFRYDGSTATIYHIDLESYSVVETGQTVDATLDLLRDEYGYALPLADLIHGDPEAALLEGATDGYHLGRSTVDGIACNHIAFRQPGVDWDLWVEDSIWAYPRKFVVTYTEVEGSPQYTATFSNWDYGAGLNDEMFEFVPPPEALKIRWAERSE